jgi:hypothetical protein
VPIPVDDWWEHHGVTQKRQNRDLVRDVRKIAELGKQILWDGVVRAVEQRKRRNGKSVTVERTAHAAFLKGQTHRMESRAMWEIPVASIRISYSLFAGAKPRSRLCIKRPRTTNTASVLLYSKRPRRPLRGENLKICYVNKTND